jgi:hypothetical protein
VQQGKVLSATEREVFEGLPAQAQIPRKQRKALGAARELTEELGPKGAVEFRAFLVAHRFRGFTGPQWGRRTRNVGRDRKRNGDELHGG